MQISALQRTVIERAYAPNVEEYCSKFWFYINTILKLIIF